VKLLFTFLVQEFCGLINLLSEIHKDVRSVKLRTHGASFKNKLSVTPRVRCREKLSFVTQSVAHVEYFAAQSYTAAKFSSFGERRMRNNLERSCCVLMNKVS
jgi:hypothetical protein